MSKTLTGITHPERMAALMRELPSPKSVATAVRLLEQIKHEYLDAYEGYNMAVRRHGTAGSPPPNPFFETGYRMKAASDQAASNLTLADLVIRYRSDARSPFPKLRYRTRQNYEALIKRIVEDCGNEKLAALGTQDIERFHKGWTERGIVMAHSLITMLRMLFGFGTKVLEDSDCQRLSIILNRMRFKTASLRTERLTLEQVKAIIAEAHKIGRPSIALAQAIQFDCGLRQRDVIGEWVPNSEPGVSSVMDGTQKWIRGIRWAEIDQDLVLRHVTSQGNKQVVVKLSEKPLVVAELDRIDPLRSGSAVIVSEDSGLPYHSDTFRKVWRKIATAVGIPKHVKNMDARLGRKRRNSEDEEDTEKGGAAEGLASAALN